jgi:regulatory protein
MRAARGHAPASPRAAALRLLARRDYSRAELAARLRARGVPAPEIDALLEDFERLGYLSDERYAHAVVAQRAGRLASRAIARDLREKGIAADTAREALAPLAQRDELVDAMALWRRRFGQPPLDAREKGRQVRFLVARGFSASVAFRVLRAAAVPGDEDFD